MTDLPSDIRPLADRLAGYRPQPGAAFYERMERAPWNAAPARWPLRTLLLLGLLLSLFVLLMALAALVDWVGGQGAAAPGRAARPAYVVAYDRHLALSLAPSFDGLGGALAGAPAPSQPAGRRAPARGRGALPRLAPRRLSPAMG